MSFKWVGFVNSKIKKCINEELCSKIMNKEIEEYTSLREEINQLCTAIDNIIGILYAFLVAYLAYSFDKQDTIYILFSYIVMLPVYLLIISKRIASCKISAYISVFHEGEGNNWETRLINFKTTKKLRIFNIIDAYHTPIIFADVTIFILYIIKTQWNFPLSIYETSKLIIMLLFFFLIFYIAIKSRKICVNDYIDSWKKMK